MDEDAQLAAILEASKQHENQPEPDSQTEKNLQDQRDESPRQAEDKRDDRLKNGAGSE